MSSIASTVRTTFLAGAGVLTLAASGWAGTITGGNAPVAASDLDVYTNFYVLDSNNPINGNGQLTQWDIYAGAAAPTELVIYRPTGGNTYSEVGTSVMETPTLGLNQFTLTTPISVDAGDVVGLYFQGQASTEFNLNAPGAFSLGNLSGTMLFTNDNSGPGGATDFVGSSNRTYSVEVFGASSTPEPGAYALVGSLGLTGLGFLRRRRAAAK